MPTYSDPAKNKEYLRQYYLKNRDRKLAERKARYQLNRDKILEQTKAWTKAHREVARASCERWRKKNLSKSADRMAEYRDKHPDAMKAISRNYYLKHRDEVLARNREWRRKNPIKSREPNRRRAKLKAESAANLSLLNDWMVSVKSNPTAICYWCKRRVLTEDIHFDHVIPLSKGGPHRVENLCVSCGPCNLSKRDKSIRVWIKTGQQVMEL